MERDPEFQAIAPESLLVYDPNPERYLRLVANPFLGLLIFLGWIAAIRKALTGFAGPLTPMLLLVLLAALAALPLFFQFHCLDCGVTGRLSDWRRHRCPSVLQRRLAGRPRRIRGPTPPVQVVVWLIVVLALVLACRELGLLPRFWAERS